MNSMSKTSMSFGKPLGGVRNGKPVPALLTVEETRQEDGTEGDFSHGGSLLEEDALSHQGYFDEEDEEVETNWKLGWAKTEVDGTLLGRSAHWGWDLRDVR